MQRFVIVCITQEMSHAFPDLQITALVFCCLLGVAEIKNLDDELRCGNDNVDSSDFDTSLCIKLSNDCVIVPGISNHPPSVLDDSVVYVTVLQC